MFRTHHSSLHPYDSLWLFLASHVLEKFLSTDHVILLSLWSNCLLQTYIFFISTLILYLWSHHHKHFFFTQLWQRELSSLFDSPPLSLSLPSTGLNPPTLPSPDSCLFSPTLCRDLIEGNHSDKKPPMMQQSYMCVCAHFCVVVWWRDILSFYTATFSALSLSPPPLKCHAALSTHLPYYPPNKLFVWHRRGTEAERESERAREREREGDEKEAGELLLLTGTIVLDLWEHLFNIRRFRGLY